MLKQCSDHDSSIFFVQAWNNVMLCSGVHDTIMFMQSLWFAHGTHSHMEHGYCVDYAWNTIRSRGMMHACNIIMNPHSWAINCLWIMVRAWRMSHAWARIQFMFQWNPEVSSCGKECSWPYASHALNNKQQSPEIFWVSVWASLSPHVFSFISPLFSSFSSRLFFPLSGLVAFLSTRLSSPCVWFCNFMLARY